MHCAILSVVCYGHYFCEIFHIKFWHLVFKLGSKKVKFLLKGWRNSPRSPRQISLILFLFPRTNSFCLLQWDEVIFKLHSWQEWGGFYFRSTNSNSYESWHLQLKFETLLRLLRLILWPQEVSEVTEVKMKKIWGENPRIPNFWLTET